MFAFAQTRLLTESKIRHATDATLVAHLHATDATLVSCLQATDATLVARLHATAWRKKLGKLECKDFLVASNQNLVKIWLVYSHFAEEKKGTFANIEPARQVETHLIVMI